MGICFLISWLLRDSALEDLRAKGYAIEDLACHYFMRRIAGEATSNYRFAGS